jgi:hypothetical protein
VNGEAEHHDGKSMQWRRAIHLMVDRKQKDRRRGQGKDIPKDLSLVSYCLQLGPTF